MRVLMLSTEQNVLNPTSRQAKRIFSYATSAELLDIVVFGKGRGRGFAQDNITVHYIGASPKFFSFLKGLFLGQAIVYNKKIDVITSQDPFFLGLVGFLLKISTGAKLHLQVHTNIFSLYWQQQGKNKLLLGLAKFLLKRAQRIRVVAGNVKEDLADKWGIEEQKIDVLPIVPRLEHFSNIRPVFPLKEKYRGRFVILMMTRLAPVKNIHIAMKAAARLREKYPDIVLVIVGKGEEESRLKSLAGTLRVADTIEFVPWTDRPEAYYHIADVFVLTSKYEGREMATLEAMASGVAVVTTPVGWAEEIVRDGENGLIVPVDDEKGLEKALERLMVDNNLRKKLAEKGRETVNTFMSQEEYARKVTESWAKAARA